MSQLSPAPGDRDGAGGTPEAGGFLWRKELHQFGAQISMGDAGCALQEHPREIPVPPSRPTLQKMSTFFLPQQSYSRKYFFFFTEEEEEGDQEQI